MDRSGFFALLTLAGAASPALAQLSNVHFDNKHCWGENIGFLDWHDAGSPQGAQGVRLLPAADPGSSILSGFIWGENVGWISVGDGAPDSGPLYSLTVGPDTGVNVAPDGSLSGYAWGENIGWINFGGGAMATPPQPARFDTPTRRLYGYAWGENVGWINLNDANVYVAFLCPADFNGDGFVTGDDFDEFTALYDAGDPGADVNGDGFANGDDFDYYTQHFDAGC
jgi:hypothetical protein